jgi:hypothetical protein
LSGNDVETLSTTGCYFLLRAEQAKDFACGDFHIGTGDEDFWEENRCPEVN